MNTAPPQQLPGAVKNSTTGQPLLSRLWWVIPALAGCAFSLVYLAVRTNYDDEMIVFRFLHEPISRLWTEANAEDVHPPGMYAAGRVAWLAIGSPKWLAVVPLGFWLAGVSVFVVSARPLVGKAWAMWVFAVLAFLHPHALMWSNSIRWYPYWSGLALVFVSVTLLRFTGRLPSIGLCLLAGVLAALLFYLNYLTVLLGACFVVAWLIRYGTSRASLARLAVILVLGGVLSAPQIIPFLTTHLPGNRAQRSSPAASALRMVHGLTIGEAILPWRPVAVCLVSAFMLPAWLAVAWRWIRPRVLLSDPVRRGELAVLVIYLGLAALGAAAGLGYKPRSFLVLAPMSALFLTLGCETIRWRVWPGLTILAAAAWIGAGGYNLLARTGTAKAALNEHPEEVVAKISELSQGRAALVFTYDAVLTYGLNTLRVERGQPVMVCSMYRDYIRQIPKGLQGEYQPPAIVFAVESFLTLSSRKEQEVRQAMNQVRAALAQESSFQMGYDPDYRIKSRFYRAPLPEYRYRVYYGPPAQGADYLEIIRIFGDVRVP